MDKLALLNEVIAIAKPAGVDRPQVSSMDQNLLDLGLDSLDTFLITVYLSDVYGVSEEKLRDLRPMTEQVDEKTIRRTLTANQVFDFMEANKTQDPDSVEVALKNIK